MTDVNQYPFSAIVGQDELKLALLLSAIEPGLGGVLAFGDRGTGKTTAIRGLAALLPEQAVLKGCAYRCDPGAVLPTCPPNCRGARSSGETVSEASPVITLPLGATEDRVLGAIDLEAALVNGEIRFEPGLLAAAHRGFLYIDEVNLLDDHVVDILLDVAASGVNTVERDGMGVTHPAKFVLVGSGNPEEGELRPQLLDRFGLSVKVSTPASIEERVEVIRRRDTFDREPDEFLKTWAVQDSALCEQIVSARKRVTALEAPDTVLERAAALCVSLGSDGLRGELTLIRASRALAAFRGDKAISLDHLKKVAPMALGHRLRKDPLDESDASVRVERAIQDVFGP